MKKNNFLDWVVYQIYPRSFFDGNGDGIGDLKGITQKLDYLIELGVNAVWLSPCYKSPNCDNGYDISDYRDIMDEFGTLDDWKEMISGMHDRGIKLIMDFVANHTSSEHEWFKQARTSRNNPYHDYYIWRDEIPNDWQSVFFGSAWEYNAPTNEYYLHSFAVGQPDLNWENPKVRKEMCAIIDYWVDLGVDGFRCDMVELVPAEFFKWLIKEIKKEYPDVIFIAEVYQKDQYRKYIREIGFDYLYDKSGLYDTLRTVVAKNVDDNGMPVELWQSAEGITRNWQYLGDMQPYMLNFLENHDEQRFASEFFGKNGANAFAALNVSLFLNPAPFMLYMGQELGEKGMDEEGFSGLDGRTTIFDWWSVSALRKLDTLIHKGLYKDITDGTIDAAKLQENGITEHEALIFRKYAKALRFAAKSEAVRKGMSYDLCYCNTSSEGFDKTRHFAFLRDYGNETLLFAANFSDKEAQMELTIPDHAFEWMELPVTPMLNPETRIRMNIPPMDAVMFTLSEPGEPAV